MLEAVFVETTSLEFPLRNQGPVVVEHIFAQPSLAAQLRGMPMKDRLDEPGPRRHLQVSMRLRVA